MYDYIIDFLTGIEAPGWLIYYKIIASFFGAILLLVTIILIKRANALWWLPVVKDSILGPKTSKKIANKWEKTVKRLENDDEDSFKLAIIESCEFLDNILKGIGLPGKEIDERLSHLTPVQLSNIDELARAAEIRNSIIYNAGFKVTKKEAEFVVGTIEKSLKELQAF